MIMIIYANGDSFVAGVELGDSLISDYPGYLPYKTSEKQKQNNRQWIENTYKEDHPSFFERKDKEQEIADLEYQRSFPIKLANILNCETINHAQGGSSLDRISRTTIADLIEIKKDHRDIVALIGTTCPSRSEIAGYYQNYYDLDRLGFNNAWEQISSKHRFWSPIELIEKVIDYKIEFERDYHQMINAYKNIILIQDFCKLNGIRLFWIAGHVNMNKDIEIESNLQDSRDLVALKDYCKFEYSIDMTEIASTCDLPDVLCPSGHYSETIHSIVADKLFKLIK